MKILKNKFFAIAIALILIMTFSGLQASPFVGAQVGINRTVQTYAYLSVDPNPVGVNQPATVTFWVEPVQPTGDQFHGFSVKITHPDGTVESKGPLTSLGVQTLQHFVYTPTSVGNYTFLFTYPGEVFPDENNTYLPATSMPITLTVQSQPITSYPENPLPTSYWTNPINSQNRNWNVISGNWLFLGYNATQTGYGDSYAGFNPYTTAPLAGHIMWTQQLTMGGLTGGDNTWGYYSGATYEPRLSPPIIMNGLAYYRTTSSWATSANPSYTGTECVDLRTGQVLWKNDDMSVDFGQVWNFANNPSGQGARAYLWGNTLSSQWNVYDAFTGQLLFSYDNAVSTGQWVWWPDAIISGSDGTIYAYLLDGLHNWLVEWSSSLAYSANYVSPNVSSPQTYDWTLGIQYNVTIPSYIVNSTTYYSTSLSLIGPTRQGISGNVLLAKVTDGSEKVYYEIGYDINTGKQLWVHGQSDSVQGFFTVMGDGVYSSFDIATASWVGYNLETGQKIWTTEPTTGWGDFVQYGNVIANGIMYVGTWNGYLTAYNVTNGKTLWQYYAGSAGTATPFGSWPMWGGIMVGGGVVYTGGGQESPSNPLFKGYQLFGVNATTGKGLWQISGYFAVRAIADGYLMAYNSYDSRAYVFGQGPSRTTVSAPQTGVTTSTPITITGSVTDISSGASQGAVAANFPSGLPCVSDASMSQFMEAAYMQQPMPSNITGVPVTLYVLDSNNNYRSIGTTTSNAQGEFGLTWTPDISGNYTVYAVFAGTNGYYGSSASTYIYASPPAGPTVTATPLNGLASNTTVMYGIVAIIVVIVIIGAVLALLVTRKRP